jgi:ABC-type phosphate transport system substrate-binding protein
MTDADCGATAGACASQTIDNLSRLQAVLLFSGRVTNWGSFGGYFDAKPVILCLRHAGSGTHATLDNAVMKSTWGASLVSSAKNNYATNGNTQTYNVAGLTSGTSTSLNYIWFNNGTGDMKNCLDGQIYDSVLGANQAGRSDLGIIGYMDADQPTPATNYVRVKFDGIDANRQAVRNGWYDYYTMQNIYYNTNDATNYTPVSSLITNATYGLIAFAQNPNNILNGIGISGVNESNYWATKGELRFTKSSDTAYPTTKSAVANTIPGAQQP